MATEETTATRSDHPTAFERYRHLLVPLALFLLGMWLTRHVWGGVAPEGDDLPYHLSRAQFGWSSIFRAGHLDGWMPRFGAGSQAFLLYGPGLAIVFCTNHSIAGLLSGVAWAFLRYDGVSVSVPATGYTSTM